MRVISGSLKGRTIPFVNQKYGNADITSQIVKEAVFDIIGRRINGSLFLDLFSCSGQIGIEAFSRGASYVLMNEKDGRRFSFLVRIKKEFALDGCDIMNADSDFCIKKALSCGRKFDFIYIDPPYLKEKGEASFYNKIIEKCNSILADDGVIIVQHFSANILADEIEGFVKTDTRKYGQNTLTFYEHRSTI